VIIEGFCNGFKIPSFYLCFRSYLPPFFADGNVPDFPSEAKRSLTNTLMVFEDEEPEDRL
jgi:hypothetical protein